MSLFLGGRGTSPVLRRDVLPAVERSGYAIPSSPQIIQTLAAACASDATKPRSARTRRTPRRSRYRNRNHRYASAPGHQAVTHLFRMHDPRHGFPGRRPSFPARVSGTAARHAPPRPTTRPVRASISVRSTLDAMVCGVVRPGRRRVSPATASTPVDRASFREDAVRQRAVVPGVRPRGGCTHQTCTKRTATRTLDYLFRELADRRRGPPADAGPRLLRRPRCRGEPP